MSWTSNAAPAFRKKTSFSCNPHVNETEEHQRILLPASLFPYCDNYTFHFLSDIVGAFLWCGGRWRSLAAHRPNDMVIKVGFEEPVKLKNHDKGQLGVASKLGACMAFTWVDQMRTEGFQGGLALCRCVRLFGHEWAWNCILQTHGPSFVLRVAVTATACFRSRNDVEVSGAIQLQVGVNDFCADALLMFLISWIMGMNPRNNIFTGKALIIDIIVNIC